MRIQGDHNPYIDQAELAGLMSWHDVEARLIEAARVFRDHRGEPSAWAGDAPWYLTRDGSALADYWAERLGRLALGERVDPPMGRRSVDRDAITRGEAAMGWLKLIDAEADRRLVCLVIAQLAGGARQVSWRRCLARMGLERGAGGLRKRYSRAIEAMCVRINLRKL